MENYVLFVAFSLLLTFVDVMSNQPNIASCKEKYQRFSTSHTRCQPQNTSCHIKQTGVSPEEAQQIVDLHNKYRSIIATQGKESKGLPPASDMLYMEWDLDLANVAQMQTQRCIYAHDEDGEREVVNFRVGQNIAEQHSYDIPTEADWAEVIGNLWYGEIKNFHKGQVCGSREHIPKEKAIGHFTQAIWSKSFRVGCGYTMYKNINNIYYRLYSCNYGPEGNSEGSCVYTKGPACSKCPENTACTKDAQHPGLCQRTNDEAPYTPIPVPTIYNCNFRDPDSPDCKIYTEGAKSSWKRIPALGGPYLETILQPGQNATIVFGKKITGTSNDMCIQLTYRMGPVLAKNSVNNKAKEILIIPGYNTVFTELPYYPKFSPAKREFELAGSIELKISFAVPRGATPQFFDIRSVVAFNTKCPTHH